MNTTPQQFEGTWAAVFISKILPSIFLLMVTLIASYVASTVADTSTTVHNMALQQAKTTEAVIALAKEVERNRSHAATELADHELRIRSLEGLIAALNARERRSN